MVLLSARGKLALIKPSKRPIDMNILSVSVGHIDIVQQGLKEVLMKIHGLTLEIAPFVGRMDSDGSTSTFRMGFMFVLECLTDAVGTIAIGQVTVNPLGQKC